MAMSMLKAVEPGFVSDADRLAAQEASRALAKLSGNGGVQVDAQADTGERQTFVLPAAAVRLLTDMMAQLAEGRSVAVMPRHAELTTQQAADLLNVSRPYLVSLLEQDKLPFKKVGTHRRVQLQDLLAYMEARNKVSDDAMDALAAEAQELGMGY